MCFFSIAKNYEDMRINNLHNNTFFSSYLKKSSGTACLLFVKDEWYNYT